MNVDKRILWITDNLAETIPYLPPLDGMDYLVVPSLHQHDVEIEVIKLGAIALVLHLSVRPGQIRDIIQRLNENPRTQIPITVLLPVSAQGLKVISGQGGVQWFDRAVSPYDLASAVHRHMVLAMV